MHQEQVSMGNRYIPIQAMTLETLKEDTGDEYRAMRSDGTELIIDLNSLEQTTRQVIQGAVGSITYIDQLVYHVLPKKEGAMLEVYDEGEMVSRASIKAEGDSGQTANRPVHYYVY
ncbi:hypothetical protein [Exiguobacterium sp. SH3S1]|uniref:hypothetical protein n=1 Tax=Exiguobacterium sp. SH3S1 TaxID=2510955 RepID=UPI00137545B8|nr:hypothetical protein [Exiguobacterium sp. SH3S1]